ncbi:MAG: ABC transporter ATP-binding protein [Spirochaetes bacterium]|nr:ABC transporter ATP-binding protein [Spirochaetota bacterium]
MKCIDFNGITKQYFVKGKHSNGKITAVDNLSFSIEKGEIFGLLGPNGSGKTTVVNLLTGLLVPDKGKIRVLGLDPLRDWKRLRYSFGLVPQESPLYPELNAYQNLEFQGALYLKSLKEIKDRVEHILELVELKNRASEKIKNYSGGMKRRLAIGKALLHEPEIIFLDEPTLGVDVQGSHRIWDYIKMLARQGKTVLVTTNVMSEAEYLCGRLLIIDSGNKIAEGTVDQLKSSLGKEEIIIRKKPSLDDVFLHYTGRTLRD